jgi:hypothetical protein
MAIAAYAKVQVDAMAEPFEVVELALAVLLTPRLEGQHLCPPRQVLQPGPEFSYGHPTHRAGRACLVITARDGLRQASWKSRAGGLQMARPGHCYEPCLLDPAAWPCQVLILPPGHADQLSVRCTGRCSPTSGYRPGSKPSQDSSPVEVSVGQRHRRERTQRPGPRPGRPRPARGSRRLGLTTQGLWPPTSSALARAPGLGPLPGRHGPTSSASFQAVVAELDTGPAVHRPLPCSSS